MISFIIFAYHAKLVMYLNIFWFGRRRRDSDMISTARAGRHRALVTVTRADNTL